MRKDHAFSSIQLLLLGIILVVAIVWIFFPGVIDRMLGRDGKDYKSIVLTKLGYYDDEQSYDYYHGFYDAYEYYQENMMDFVKGTQTYDDIFSEGFQMGYEEGILGIEY